MTAAIILAVSALAALAAAAAFGVAGVALRLARSSAGLETSIATSSATGTTGVMASGNSLADLPYRLVQLALILLLASLSVTAVITGHAPWTSLAETSFT